MSDLLQKYLVPVYGAPDIQGDLAPDAAPPSDAPLDSGEPPADPPEGDAPPAPRMVPESVFVREVTPLRAKVRDAEAELQNARRHIQEQNELLIRLQHTPGDAAPAPIQPSPQPSDDGDVNRRAAEMVFARDAQAVSETGFKTYGQDWVEAVNVLNAFGINSAEFVSAVMDVDRDRTHEIMHAIAKDPERAASLASLSPGRRIAEITRISIAMNAAQPKADAPVVPKTPVAPPAKTVSRAPAPAPQIEPNASKVVDWRSDEASDEEFTRGFEEMRKARSSRR